MKRQFIYVCALLVGILGSAEVFSQTEKGDWLVGGNFTLNTTRNTTISLTPNAGYFFARNFAMGGNVRLSYDKSGDLELTTLGIGPFVRYYFGKNNLRPFGLVEYNFTSIKAKSGESSTTSNGGEFFIGPGLAAFVNEHVAIETIAGYINSKYSGEPSNGGFSLRIGFQIYLSPRKIVDTYRSNGK